jgi:hypothetical protein
MQRRLSVKYLVWYFVLLVAGLVVVPEEGLYAQPAMPYTLTVSIGPGPAAGAIDDIGGGPIGCPGVCTEISGAIIAANLEATPNAPYVFDHWEWTSSVGTSGTILANPTLVEVGIGLPAETKSVTAVFRIPNSPPVLQPIGDKTANEGEVLTFDILATDLDRGDVIIYSALNLPTGASLVGRTFSWQPGYNQAGAYQVIFRADDGKEIDQETITITVNNVNRPPVLAPIGNKRTTEDTLLEFAVNATDPDGDRLTFSVSGLPTGAVFDLQRVAQTFSWIPGPNQHGSYPVTFSVTDGAATDSETIAITVADVTHSPVLNPIGNQTVQAGVLLTIQLSATDLDEDPLTFSASPLPTGAAFDAGTGAFQWTPVNSQSGSHQVAFAVSDGVFTVTETVTIAVGVGLPVLPAPFPFNQVSPLSGALNVDPTQPLCLSWPDAANSEAYQFLLARDPSFGLSMLDVPGLSAAQYCVGGAATSRTSGALAYGMNYFWTVIGSNTYGSVQYPVFGFATLFPPGATVTAPGPFPGMQYKIFSVPLYPENPDPVAVLGDDLGPYQKSNWRLFYYSSADGRNHEYPDVPDMAPGIAYWLITRSEITLDAQGSAASTAENFIIVVPPGFLQIGCPFYFPVSWNEVRVRNGNLTVPVNDAANVWISPVLWTYVNGQYQAAQELVPWKGCLVQNVSTETVELLIPPRMFVNAAASSAMRPVSITRNK